jgi:uridine kinase
LCLIGCEGHAFGKSREKITVSDLDPENFRELLFEKMRHLDPAVSELEFYEFCYGLDNLVPTAGWGSVVPDDARVIEQRIASRDFFASIDIRQKVNGKGVLAEPIAHLTRMLMVGLTKGTYVEDWVRNHFYFDVRGFYFLVRTTYFSVEAIGHLGGKPYRTFVPKQGNFEGCLEIGYKQFKEANLELDEAFIDIVEKLVVARGTPILVTIAGPTAAGKSEITARLRSRLQRNGKHSAAIEMDNFLLDNEYRDEQGIRSLGPEAYHYDIFRRSLSDLLTGKAITIPQYDSSISSHDEHGRLKPGFQPLQVSPADIVFLEGNFPFHGEDVSHLIGIKVVYLTDDPIRLKRKWKRDMDLRKKYEEGYFRNRYFRTQFLRAQDCYRVQMQVCDVLVDTTGAAIWLTPDTASALSGEKGGIRS